MSQSPFPALDRAPIPDRFLEVPQAQAIAMVVLNCLVVLFAGVTAYHIQHWAAYLVAFILVGARAQALYILQHEAMHWLVAKNRKLNDVIGVLVSGLIGTQLFYGRRFHFKHHARIGFKDDPNEYWHHTDTPDRAPGWPIAWFYLSTLLGSRLFGLIPRVWMRLMGMGKDKAQTKASNQISDADTGSAREKRIDLLGLLAMQALVVTTISLLSSPWIYLTHFLAPIVTLTCFFELMRSFSEHFLPGKPSNAAEFYRNFYLISNPLELFFISQFQFHYHHVHHLYANVSTFHCRELHFYLLENDPKFAEKFRTRDGYLITAWRYMTGQKVQNGGEMQTPSSERPFSEAS